MRFVILSAAKESELTIKEENTDAFAALSMTKKPNQKLLCCPNSIT
jgi:hypothetical protein